MRYTKEIDTHKERERHLYIGDEGAVLLEVLRGEHEVLKGRELVPGRGRQTREGPLEAIDRRVGEAPQHRHEAPEILQIPQLRSHLDEVRQQLRPRAQLCFAYDRVRDHSGHSVKPMLRYTTVP